MGLPYNSARDCTYWACLSSFSGTSSTRQWEETWPKSAFRTQWTRCIWGTDVSGQCGSTAHSSHQPAFSPALHQTTWAL